MNNAIDYSEALIERDLQELLGGDTPPDLIQQTLAAAQASRESADPRRRWLTTRRLAEAAVIVLAIGLIGWLVTRPRALPPTVTASADAAYMVRGEHVALKQGWLLLTPGAPEVRAGSDRIHDVQGRALAGATVPQPGEAAVLANRMNLSDKEQAMLSNPKRWIKAGALTLCLFTGTACVNGEPVSVVEETPERIAPVYEEPGVLKVLREWTGANSKIGEPRAQLVENMRAWSRLWSEHETGGWVVGAIDPPAVDFGNEIVLAVFGGKGWNSRGYEVVEILQGPRAYTVRVVKLSFQTAGGAVEASPFGIFVLPRTDRPIQLEHNVQNIIGDPPLWQLEKDFIGFTETTDIRSDMIQYLPDQEVHDSLGSARAGEGAEFSFITSSDSEAGFATLLESKIPGIEKLSPDFRTQIVVVAAHGVRKDPRSQLDPHHSLEFVGRSEQRTVLRITPPVEPLSPAGEMELIYSIWVLPKPPAGLVIEKPVYPGRESRPVRWKEAYAVK